MALAKLNMKNSNRRKLVIETQKKNSSLCKTSVQFVNQGTKVKIVSCNVGEHRLK